jgi:hypothetical protein
LTGGTGIGTSGTYPNLTVSNTLPNATHTGDATGGSSLTVGKIQGRSIATTAPSNGEVLQWNMFSLKWEPATDDNTTYTAGSGINVAGTVISNTSPDQTVVLTGGTGIGTSGTYPNFTVTNILPNATHTGDATGGSSMIVEKIRGHTVSSIAPTNNQILQWNGSAWTPTTLATPSQDWTLYGNAGTSSVAHFIGTTDNKALKFKVNNQKAGWLDPSMLANTSFGYQALNAVSGDGTDNTALGYKALYSNTTGAQNIAVGRDAIYSNLTGISNIAIGCYALHENNDGDNNLAIGNFSLHDNTIGKNNTAIGNDALIDNVDGEYNTATGVDAMGQNTTGDFNTGIGYFALNNNSTGSYNTAIGCASYFSGSPNNSTSLGNEAGIGIYGNNKVAIGNTSVSWIGGQVGWSTFSDGRINDNVKQDVAGLDFINRLRPITYNLNIHRQNEMCGKDEKKSGDWPEKYDIEKMRMTGFIAQEVEKAAQDAGYDFSGIDKPVEGGLYSLRYSDFVVPLVKAVQEQQVIIDNQQKQIEELMKRIEILENK